MVKIFVQRCFILLCLITSINCFAESVYSIDPEKDLIIGSLCLGLTVSSLFINRSANNASTDGFPLPKDNINVFDRNVMYEYNKPLDITSDIVLYGLIAMPVISLAGDLADKYAWVTHGVM